MGLFGLGVPEIAVIAGIAVLVFGMFSTHLELCLVKYLRNVFAACVNSSICLRKLPSVAGPSKLPELGKELGKSVKSFQTAAKVYFFLQCSLIKA
jgi:hypothetical protein